MAKNINNIIPFVTLNEEDKKMIPLPKAIQNGSSISAAYVFDKCIVNAMHQVYVKGLIDNIPQHCNKALFKILQHANQMFYMPYDRDDLDEEDCWDEVFYDEIFEEKNNWDNIDMPLGCVIDRNASSSIKVEKVPFFEDTLKSEKSDIRPKPKKIIRPDPNKEVLPPVKDKKPPVRYILNCRCLKKYLKLKKLRNQNHLR